MVISSLLLGLWSLGLKTDDSIFQKISGCYYMNDNQDIRVKIDKTGRFSAKEKYIDTKISDGKESFLMSSIYGIYFDKKNNEVTFLAKNDQFTTFNKYGAVSFEIPDINSHEYFRFTRYKTNYGDGCDNP